MYDSKAFRRLRVNSLIYIHFLFENQISPLITQFPQLTNLIELYLRYTGKLPLTAKKIVLSYKIVIWRLDDL